jgi:glycerol-3-phosphate dehydrogenase (NAD(P)+)
MNVTVIGAGGWGTALALLLHAGEHNVRLWVRRPEFCEHMRQQKENANYLPGVRLPEQLQLTSSLTLAVENTQLIVFAVPSHAMRTVASTFFREASPVLQEKQLSMWSKLGRANRRPLRP